MEQGRKLEAVLEKLSNQLGGRLALAPGTSPAGGMMQPSTPEVATVPMQPSTGGRPEGGEGEMWEAMQALVTADGGKQGAGIIGFLQRAGHSEVASRLEVASMGAPMHPSQ